MKMSLAPKAVVAGLMVSLAGAGAALGKEAGMTLKGQTCQGTLTAVNPTARTVSVKTFWSHKTFNAATGCKVSLENHQATTLADLHPGQEVEVRYENAQGVLVANGITVEHDLVCKGHITAIDPARHTLHVNAGLFGHDFTVNNACNVQLNGGRSGSLTDLKPGQPVTVLYEQLNGKRTATRIEQLNPTFVGTITALDAEARTVKLQNLLSEKTFHLGDGCRIAVNGRITDRLADLRLGERAFVTYKDEHGVLIARQLGQGRPVVETAKAPTTVASNPAP